MKELKLDVKPLIKKLEAAIKKSAEARLLSRYRIIFKGKGLEFEEHRVYTDRDDAKLIDWKATVRSDKTLMKQYKEERDIDVYLLLDASSSMIFGSTPKLKNEYAAEIVAALAYIVLETGDCPGLYMFNDKITASVPPSNKKDQYYQILRNLINPKNYGGNCNFEVAIKHIINFAKRKGILVIVSDFFGIKGDWTYYLKIASAKFDVITIIVHDPRDEILPKDIGKVVISDPFSNTQIMFDPDIIAEKYEVYAKQKHELIKHQILTSKTQLLEVRTDKDFIKEFLLFLKRRERELI